MGWGGVGSGFTATYVHRTEVILSLHVATISMEICKMFRLRKPLSVTEQFCN